ncbi:spore coat protein X [Evansella vedderi]|uniref:Spore coat protein X n=1 Tax=Evansella vedderi TaxID=38282 RepID=A0ABT9ZZB3_9BACI|nr:spore coat protein [Evansella vedderi]MDQ0256092.1 spore coat protein X [Evansella vedderi]
MNQEVYRSSDAKRNWDALNPDSAHPLCDRKDFQEEAQEAVNKSKTLQLNEEYIFIKDSCDVTVTSTDTKGALNIQAGIQTAIAVLISLSVDDPATAEKLTQELLQTSKIKQVSFQKTVVENSRNVEITTVDAQIAANIQILVQILIAVAIKLDLL